MSSRVIAAIVLAVTVGLASACSGDGEGEGEAAKSEAAKSEAVASSDPADVNEPKADIAKSAKPDKKGRQAAVLGRVQGDEGGACVEANDGRNVRSGQFLAGPFDEATEQWGKSKEGLKEGDLLLYWVPLHAKKMPGITVVATHEGSDEQVKVSQDEFGQVEEWKYYNVAVNLPQSGTWVLRGSAGPDRGCFKVTVG